MSGIHNEKDLERGESAYRNVTTIDEKRGELSSQQSSPTLTQGTFESERDAKGIESDQSCRNHSKVTNIHPGADSTLPSPRWTTRIGKAFSWPRSKNKSEKSSVAQSEEFRVRKCM